MVDRIDLLQFCHKTDDRPYLMKPHRIGAFTYATNGHILVRVDAVEGDEMSDGFPGIGSLKRTLSSDVGVGQFVPIGALSFPDNKRVICDFCGGAGQLDDDDDPAIECPDCDGIGNVEKLRSVSIDGVNFQDKYVGWIAALPDARISRPPPPVDPMRFQFTGGVGVLMPMYGQGHKHLGQIEQYAVTAMRRRIKDG